MILDQLKIASNIVVITYVGLIGALALGMSLAFGLGGREVAGRLLEGAYQKGQESAEQVKADVAQGASGAKEEAQAAKEKAERESRSGVTEKYTTRPPGG